MVAHILILLCALLDDDCPLHRARRLLAVVTTAIANAIDVAGWSRFDRLSKTETFLSRRKAARRTAAAAKGRGGEGG